MLIHKKYFVSIDDANFEIENISDVKEMLYKSFNFEKGSIFFAADDGERPWWQRFVFGAKIYVRSYFKFEWSGRFSGLIFYDENSSEYRSLFSGGAEEADASVRMEIAFGEAYPLEIKYCIPKDIGVKAIQAFLSSGEKPQWLKYEFVE